MKSVPKIIRRFIGILLLSSMLLIVLNFILLAIYVSSQTPNALPWKTAEKVAENLYQDKKEYTLPDGIMIELKNTNVWAILINDNTKQVVWKTDNLPETVPMSYTISDIASLTRGYINEYPTFTGEAENGLVVLGYPKDSFWKHMWPSWDYQFIANFPKTVLSVLAINITLIFIIYAIANSKLLKSVRPIVNSIQALHTKEPVYIKEKGLLSELAMSINKTSEILQSQSNQLRRRETARANWIAGVSHDIRTPLAMVMGYASQLKENTHLTEDERQKAGVIVKQSERMKNLINDLNLASKLEYNMQPINLSRQNIIAIVRQVVVDFINTNIDDKHSIEWETDEALTLCTINVDKDLIKRAINNLIQNCINHNEHGCKIYIRIIMKNETCSVVVSDDGIGATDEQIKKLNNAPHYMVCDENTTKQRHGLGLLIVKQIATSHGGTTEITHSSYGGLSVKINLPMENYK